MESPHVSVLLEESVGFFVDIPSGTVVDCTMGYGGHSGRILESNKNISVIGIDRDKEAIAFSGKKFANEKRISFINAPFSEGLAQVDPKEIRGVIADLGVSSLQLDKEDRGFGFDSLSLDMRMNQASGKSAADILNTYREEELAEIFFKYGEIRESKKLAREIAAFRQKQRFSTPRELVEICAKVIHKSSINPATLAFQALRIEVNDELGELERALDAMEKFRDCTVAIITFHSLEDRIVKQRFKKWGQNCICSPDVFRCECGNNNALGCIITKKPIAPSNEEIRHNRRSRSAKLRVFKLEGN